MIFSEVRLSKSLNIFSDVEIKGGKRGISFPQGPNGRSNGEAFIELEREDQTEDAMAHHKRHMGRRYIEGLRCHSFIFRSLSV